METEKLKRIHLRITNCQECPFVGWDYRHGFDSCGLADFIDHDIDTDTSEQLPKDKRHEDCPLGETTLIQITNQ